MKSALVLIAGAGIFMSAHALDLVGMEVDKPINCDLLSFMSNTHDTTCAKTKELEWTSTLEFLDKPTPVLISRAPDGTLKSIVMTGFDYDRAIAALRVQFGKPVNMNRDEAVWVRKDQSMRVMRYAGLGSTLVYAGKAAEKN